MEKANLYITIILLLLLTPIALFSQTTESAMVISKVYAWNEMEVEQITSH